jgi:hypothetical protein
MGLAAMDMLQALIRGEKVESRRLATSLLIRQSTGRPPESPRLDPSMLPTTAPEPPQS